MITDSMPVELRLAAIIALLSSSAVNGASSGKTSALCAHLQAILAVSDDLDPCLTKSLQIALTNWQSLEQRFALSLGDVGKHAVQSHFLH